MKKRLIVMNSQRITQHEENGQWKSDKIDKANGIKPGIYNLYLATQADKSKIYTGIILQADKTSVHQQIGENYIKHNGLDFDKLPEIGLVKSISYDAQNKAKTGSEAIKLSQGRKI